MLKTEIFSSLFSHFLKKIVSSFRVERLSFLLHLSYTTREVASWNIGRRRKQAIKSIVSVFWSRLTEKQRTISETVTVWAIPLNGLSFNKFFLNYYLRLLGVEQSIVRYWIVVRITRIELRNTEVSNNSGDKYNMQRELRNGRGFSMYLLRLSLKKWSLLLEFQWI